MVEAEVCLADTLHLVETVVVVDSHLSDELLLCSTQLAGGELYFGNAAKLVLDKCNDAVLSIKVDTGVDIEQACVGEGDVLRLNGVAESVTLTYGHIEARVHSRTAKDVVHILNDDYVIVALHTDDKTKLPQDQWLTIESGKVLKDRGRVNSYIVRERFGVNAQHNYALLSPEGQLLAPVRGYDLSIPGFLEFLRQGLN